MSEQEENDQKAKATNIDASGLAVESNHGVSEERIAELERQLQSERVEHGRAKKLADENRQLREELDRIKAEVASLKERKPEDFLSPEERDQIDTDQAHIMGKMAKGFVDDAIAPLKAENEELRSRIKAGEDAKRTQTQAEYTNGVNRLAPGLLKVVLSDHKEAWNKWASNPMRMASIGAAIQNHDAETTAHFLNEFCSENGISSSGDGEPALVATPKPNSGSGVASIRDGTIYTFEQYDAARRNATADRESGKINVEEYRAIIRKLDAAVNEGRVRM